MDIIRKIEFNPELQWTKEMASPYVAAITNFIIREDNVKVESIDNPKPKGLSFEEYMKREDDIYSCHDLCRLLRQMGYIAYINDSRIDGFPATVTAYNLPFTPSLANLCHTYGVSYLEYITPEKDRARIERWEDVAPITKTRIEHEWKFENTYTSYMFEKFDLEDFGYLTMDLMHCTSYKLPTALSVMCTIHISSKIKEVLSSHFEGKDKAERLRLYAEALNDDDVLCPNAGKTRILLAFHHVIDFPLRFLSEPVQQIYRRKAKRGIVFSTFAEQINRHHADERIFSRKGF